jgi:hypothetical protein
MEETTHRGSCICGAVTFEVDGELKPPDACHCTQCRKLSGHCLGAFDTPTRTKLAIHIFVSEKGDYYELNDGLPQNER